ncbi:MAG: MerR family transcriptional regulator [Coprobacillus cateniformis]
MYIQEISQKLQLSKKAINLYEEKGLIQPQKDDHGYRIYLEKEKQTLLKIKQLRRLGFHLEEIKKCYWRNNIIFLIEKKTEYQEKLFPD